MGSLVFFGAGASKPFGIPTMQEMVDEFENDLEKKDPKLYRFYVEIKNILVSRNASIKIDIEAMLSVVDGIVKNMRLDQMDHFMFYYGIKRFDGSQPTQFSANDVKLAKKLKEKLRNYVKRVCKPEYLSKDEIYKKSYVPFFKHIIGKKKSFDDYELVHDWKSYTTNYDNVFEGFWDSFERPIDHFQESGSSNLINFDSDHLESAHTFCKLHGSLDWGRKTETGKITRRNSHGFSRYTIEGEAMLFPTQQKDLYLYPWFSLFADLRRGLLIKNNWYVVGYAFNDEFIKNGFEESMINDSNKKLIIIDPDARKIKKKFHKSVQSKIDALPIRFGDKYFELQFKDHINSSRTLVLTFHFPESYFSWTLDDFFIGSDHHIISSRIITVNNTSKHNIMVDAHNSNDMQSEILLSNIKDNVYELKLELTIEYKNNDELRLYVSYNDVEMNLGVNYGSRQIFKSKNDSLNTFRTGSIVWSGPINISNTDFYS